MVSNSCLIFQKANNSVINDLNSSAWGIDTEYVNIPDLFKLCISFQQM